MSLNKLALSIPLIFCVCLVLTSCSGIPETDRQIMKSIERVIITGKVMR